MARNKNDGKGRIGGRSKGTPNKTTATLREWIAQIIDDNRQQMMADIRQLTPIDRLKYLEKLMGYVLPKPTDLSDKENYKTDLGEIRIGFGEDYSNSTPHHNISPKNVI